MWFVIRTRTLGAMLRSLAVRGVRGRQERTAAMRCPRERETYLLLR